MTDRYEVRFPGGAVVYVDLPRPSRFVDPVQDASDVARQCVQAAMEQLQPIRGWPGTVTQLTPEIVRVEIIIQRCGVTDSGV